MNKHKYFLSGLLGFILGGIISYLVFGTYTNTIIMITSYIASYFLFKIILTEINKRKRDGR